MKNSFKKIILIFTSALSSVGSYMFSGQGIIAATLGSLTAVTIFATEKKKTTTTNKNMPRKTSKKEEPISKEKTKKTTTTSKKDVKKKISSKKIELKKHRNELKKLKRTGSGATPEAQHHSTIIQDLENSIEDLKEELKKL